MTHAAIIPPLVALPVAGLAMLVAASHLVVVEQHRGGDNLRRRIRLANGWVMLLAIPLIAAGASLIDPSAKPRMFVIVWTSVAGLVVISILLAVADILNTSRLARRSWRELRETRSRLLHAGRHAHGPRADEDRGA